MAIALCCPADPTPTPPVAVVHLTLRPLILSGRAPRRDRTLPPRLETLRGLPIVLGERPREESGEEEKTEMEWLEMWEGAGEEG